MAYITKDELKDFTGVNFTSALDTFADLVISQVTSYIEQLCGDSVFGKRIFEAPTPDNAETRYFNGNGQTQLFVGDLKNFTSLTVDNQLLVENDDFYLYPLNAVNQSTPYYWIELIQPETKINANSRIVKSSPYVFEIGQRNVVIEGKWRYSDDVPADIKLVALKLASAVLKENIGDEDIRETKSTSIGDYRVDFVDIKSLAHHLSVDDILKNYTRINTVPASGFKAVVEAGQVEGNAFLRQIS